MSQSNQMSFRWIVILLGVWLAYCTLFPSSSRERSFHERYPFAAHRKISAVYMPPAHVVGLRNQDSHGEFPHRRISVNPGPYEY